MPSHVSFIVKCYSENSIKIR